MSKQVDTRVIDRQMDKLWRSAYTGDTLRKFPSHQNVSCPCRLTQGLWAGRWANWWTTRQTMEKCLHRWHTKEIFPQNITVWLTYKFTTLSHSSPFNSALISIDEASYAMLDQYRTTPSGDTAIQEAVWLSPLVGITQTRSALWARSLGGNVNSLHRMFWKRDRMQKLWHCKHLLYFTSFMIEHTCYAM